jgi:hypothetical protein
MEVAEELPPDPAPTPSIAASQPTEAAINSTVDAPISEPVSEPTPTPEPITVSLDSVLNALEEERQEVQAKRAELSQFLASFLETQTTYLELLQQQVDTEREEEGDENNAKNAEIRSEVVKEFQMMLQQKAQAPELLAFSS